MRETQNAGPAEADCFLGVDFVLQTAFQKWYQNDERHEGVVRLVAAEVFRTVMIASLAGWAIGLASARYIESLLYHVTAAAPAIASIPPVAILIVTLMATLPAVLRALRIEPAEILRSE